MGEIRIKGFGNVKIAGDEPTAEELNTIKEYLKNNKDLVNSDAAINQQTNELLEGPNWGRLVLEVGGSILGSFMTGGLALPLLAARVGMISRPFLSALLKSSTGSGIGGGVGAATAETFDPSDHAFKRIIQASAAGFAGEALGAPIGIKVFNQVAKIARPALKEHDAVAKGEAVLNGKIDAINKTVQDFGYDRAVQIHGKNLVEAAADARITPGVRYDNTFLDILENVSERSLFGTSGLRKAKQATRDIASSVIDDYNANLAKIAGRQNVSAGAFQTGDDVGDVFINALSGSNKTFKNAVKDNYTNLLKEYDSITKKSLKEVPVPRGEEDFVGGSTIIKRPIFELDNRIIDTKDVLRALEDLESSSSQLYVNADEALNALRKNIKNLQNNPKLSFREVLDLKKGINDSMPPITVGNKAAFNKVGKALRDAGRNLTLGSKDLPESFKKAVTAADDFFTAGNDFFNKSTLQQITKGLTPNYLGQLEGNGSQVINEILNHKHPSIMKKLFEALDDGVQKKIITQKNVDYLKVGLKSKLFNDLIESSAKQKGIYNEAFDPDVMMKNFKNRQGAFEQVFTKAELKTMDDNIAALRLAYGKIADEGSLPGGVAITLAQPGALYQLGGALAFGTGTFQVGGAILLAGPWAVSKAFTNKSVAKYLQKSFQTIQEEAVASHKAAGAGNFAGISNFRKTMTSLRQLSEQLLSQRIIDENMKESFDSNLPIAIEQIRENIRLSNQKEQTSVDLIDDSPKLDSIDEAISDFVEPQSMAPVRPQTPAPRPQASGIASLQNRPEQLQKLEQVGLPLFDRG